MNNKKLGTMGEQLALEFLKNQKYQILSANFRCPYGEIDIIAKDNRTIVFVEVKTRSSLHFGKGMEAVNHYKQQKLRKAALCYLNENNSAFADLRFDVIDILIKENSLMELIHIKNAF